MESKNKDNKNEIKNKRLLVVNTGSVKKKFILQRLKKLGVQIIVLNKEKNWAQPFVDEWIITDTTNHDETLRALEAYIRNEQMEKINGVVTFWEDDVLLTSKIVDKFNFIGIPHTIARKARNKFLFRKFCSDNGIRTPEYYLANTRRSLHYALRKLTFPLVVKPTYGSSSAYVVKVENEEELFNVYEYINKNMSTMGESALSDGLEIMVEEYIDGDEVDVDILLQNGKIKFHSITDNDKTNEPFFVETGQSIPSNLPVRDQEALLTTAEEVLEKLGIQNGCIHFEAKSTSDGPVPIEVNLRMGGDEVYSFVKGAWGIDLIDNAVRIALGIYIPNIKKPETPFKYMAGKYFISESSGILATWDVEKSIHKEKYLIELAGFKEIGDPVLVPPEGYENLGWITVSGANHKDARDNLNEAFKAVSFSVSKFDSESFLGKTSRKNRFSSAVLNKDLLLRSAKLQHIKNTSIRNIEKLHFGILGHRKATNGTNGSKKGDTVGSHIEKAMMKLGYKYTFFEIDNFTKAFSDIRNADVDIVFNAVEQDNSLPLLPSHAASMLEMLQIPYTGSQFMTLSLCKDKINMKKLLNYHNIPTPKWDYAYDIEDEISTDLKYPLIVKPSDTDDSIGITNKSVVTNKKELYREMEKIISQNHPAIIEEYIEGDEYNVSILGSDEEDYQVLPLSRSIFKNMPEGFWHIIAYDAKWGHNSAYNQIINQMPAKNINKKLEALITEIALDTYSILDCRDYGRVEIRVDQDNNPYVLELNPNPSLRNDGFFYETMKTIKLNYEDLINEVIRLAVKRYQTKFSTNTNIPFRTT